MSLYQPSLLWRLIDIAKSLSTEKDPWRLLDRILTESLTITGCDGGTLYLLQEDEEGTWLNYAILHNHSLNIAQTSRDGQESALMPVSVYDRKSGEPNHHNIAAHCALSQTTIKIDDVQQEKRFDVSGIKSFDDLFDYHTRSILTVPLLNKDGASIGVIQLVNARNPIGNVVQPFTPQDVNVVQALAALVAITLDYNALVSIGRNKGSAPQQPQSPNVLERIVEEGMALTHAEGGTLYLFRNDPRRLEFAVLHNTPLGLYQGGSSTMPVNLAALPLEKDGTPNLNNIATFAAISNKTVNIGNAYENVSFDFTGVKQFDTSHQYQSRSFLAVPLRDHRQQLLGVLQLVNARGADGKVATFTQTQESRVQGLAAYAAIALETWMQLDRASITANHLREQLRSLADGKNPPDSVHDSLKLAEYLLQQINFQTL